MTVDLELAKKAKELVKEVFGKYNSSVNEKLDNIKFEIARPTKGAAEFDRNNTVYIHYNSLKDLSIYVHELLHVVSTSNSFNKQYIGFHKRHTRKIGDDFFVQTNLGYAINEGATECFTREVIDGKFEKAVGDTTYNFCSNIYKNLEKILTPQTSKILYANGNADNFVEAIAKNAHTSQDNVIKLILNMDAYLDTSRVFKVFLMNPNSADVKHLLTNCYTYLAVIMSDYAKYQGKSFNVWEDISKDYLTKEDLMLFAEVISGVDITKVGQANSQADLKTYERVAMHLLAEQQKGTLANFDLIPDYLKCGEFYNFLLLGTQFCDKNDISCDIITKDENAKLTQKIYSPKYCALEVNQYLPQNVATMLAARYAIRANTATSDYYMELAMNSKKFREFMVKSDPDYYEAMCELIKSKNEPQDVEQKPQETQTNTQDSEFDR